MKNLLHKLALGTAQLGLDYGINNQAGKPDREKALGILAFAYANGIKVYDTAYAYGDAEEILGEFLKSQSRRDEIKIITKLNPETLNAEQIANSLKQSLSRLKVDQLDGLLLHSPEHLRNEKIIKALDGLKMQGLTKNIGVSIYEPDDAIYAAGLKEIDYIQAPYNIFDQRLDQADFFRLTKKNGKTVFARSAFLQGLFFMPEEKIPAGLAEAKNYLKKLDKIIAKYGLTRQQAALLFSLNNENIDYAVIGVDNTEQLSEYINIAKHVIIFEDCLKELKQEFKNTDKKIITPYLWEK